MEPKKNNGPVENELVAKENLIGISTILRRILKQYFDELEATFTFQEPLDVNFLKNKCTKLANLLFKGLI
ncbi:MAG: hypothetical protein R2799_13880 [Crocinitomicaceae bacterium]